MAQKGAVSWSRSLGIMGGGRPCTRESWRSFTTSPMSVSHRALISGAQSSSASSWWPVGPGCTLRGWKRGAVRAYRAAGGTLGMVRAPKEPLGMLVWSAGRAGLRLPGSGVGGASEAHNRHIGRAKESLGPR